MGFLSVSGSVVKQELSVRAMGIDLANLCLCDTCLYFSEYHQTMLLYFNYYYYCVAHHDTKSRYTTQPAGAF